MLPERDQIVKTCDEITGPKGNAGVRVGEVDDGDGTALFPPNRESVDMRNALMRRIAAAGMALSVSLGAMAQTSAVGPGDPASEKSTDQSSNAGPAMSGTLSTPRASGTYGGTVETGTAGNGPAETSGTDSVIPIPHKQ
jgi:hypothetical protein